VKTIRPLISIAIIAQLIVLGFFNEEVHYRSKPSVNEFYDVELFTQIKDYIGMPVEDYRVASIGLHPVIAQYNGFYTLDSYNNFYPLTYKYQFRKIINNELEKNKTIRQYFDEWGGRCYLFTDELGKHYMFKKRTKRKLNEVQFNMEPFKELGGKFIFSSVPIVNAEENQLQLQDIFTNDHSVWKIYLYQVL
jgi:hypothetical protein